MFATGLREMLSRLGATLAHAWEVLRSEGPSKAQFWLLALGLGAAAGAAALAFRIAVTELERLAYGGDDRNLTEVVAGLPWWWIVLVPVAGGFAVGLLLHFFTPDGRVRSVADVIAGAALNRGRVERRAGIASALASLVTLSTGGSSGREGPVVHIAGVMSSWVADRINASGMTGRDLLGCAVAGAVSASFNAPIAGTIFALEVVLRHFAVHAFAPIVIAAVAGTVINRLRFEGVTEFSLPTEGLLPFHVELPAFLLLGVVAGVAAVAVMRAIFWADDIGTWVQRRLGVPRWLRPTLAGLLLGVIAIRFPHVIGVGYHTTSAALTGGLAFGTAVVFAIVKGVALAITMGGRMGGGVFSPSLMIGALVGLAFGDIATSIFPTVSGSETLYALAGMGAVAAAVLGAPISTTLIVFEMTGDWHTALAVMTAVSTSVAVAARLFEKSFFLALLERRNIHIAAGPQAYLLGLFRVVDIMRPLDRPGAPPEEELWDLVERGLYVDANATLEAAMPIFERSDADRLAVVTLPGEDRPPELWGVLLESDALRAYNRALREVAAEEHA